MTDPTIKLSATQLANIAAQISVAHERLGWAISAFEDAVGFKFADAVAEEITTARAEMEERS